MNFGTSWIDGGRWLYGNTFNEAKSKRRGIDGQLITDQLSFGSADELVAALLEGNGTEFMQSSLWEFYELSTNTEISDAGLSSGISGGSTSTSCPFTEWFGTKEGESNHNNFQVLNALFSWEHNRIAKELREKYRVNDDEWLYQEARARNIALIQKITYTEYIPLFLAFPFTVFVHEYNSSIDASSTLLFCSLTQRYGHHSQPNRMPFGGYHDEEGKPHYGGIQFYLIVVR